MKIFYFKVNKSRKITSLVSNLVIAIMLVTVFGFSFAGGTLKVFNSNSDGLAIYNGNLNSRNVSLMINVYWGDEFLDDMLSVIKEKNIINY